MKHNILMVAILAAFLALAGCGGGSSSDSGDTGGDMMGPTPEEMALSAAQTAADTAATNAETAASMAEADVIAIIAFDGEDHDRVATARSVAANARAAATRARTASDNAQAAETSAAAAAFQTTAESDETTAANLRMSVGDLLTAARNAETKRVADAMTAAITKVAETKEMAIMTEAGQAADAGLGGTARTDADGTTTAADTSDDVYTLAIERDRDGTTIKITDPNNAGDDDPKFAQAEDLGHGRTMHTRDMEADDDGNVMTEVVVVTTDIEAPKATKFATVYPFDVTKETGQAATGENENDSLAIPDNASPSPAELTELGRVMSTAFTAGTAATLTFLPAVDDADTNTPGDQPRDAYETSGVYDGAAGMYTCTGTDNCTVVLDAMGEITAMTGGWVFTPNSGVTVDVPDGDYLRYGFWLKRTADEDGVVTYNEVETFAGSSIDASGDVSDVLGTASYSGGATGVYVHTVLKSDGSRAQATSGHFSADASLSATFGQVPVSDTDTTGTIAPNQLNTVTGIINNFDLSGGEEQTWSVALSGSITPGDGTSSGMAKGGSGNGSYSATFHGPVAAVDGVVPHPHSVVGEFNAGFTNGSVAGAFGAREDDD